MGMLLLLSKSFVESRIGFFDSSKEAEGFFVSRGLVESAERGDEMRDLSDFVDTPSKGVAAVRGDEISVMPDLLRCFVFLFSFFSFFGCFSGLGEDSSLFSLFSFFRSFCDLRGDLSLCARFPSSAPSSAGGKARGLDTFGSFTDGTFRLVSGELGDLA